MDLADLEIVDQEGHVLRPEEVMKAAFSGNGFGNHGFGGGGNFRQDGSDVTAEIRCGI